MRIKTILNKLFLLGTIFFTLLVFTIDSAFAEYYLAYGGPAAGYVRGCVKRHKVKHHRKHKRVKRHHCKRRYGYSITVMRPACGPCCAPAPRPRPVCGGCSGSYLPAFYAQPPYYDVYYRQPEYYRDYSDRYDTGYSYYYNTYNNDMRTGDDMAIGMDIDY